MNRYTHIVIAYIIVKKRMDGRVRINVNNVTCILDLLLQCLSNWR